MFSVFTLAAVNGGSPLNGCSKTESLPVHFTGKGVSECHFYLAIITSDSDPLRPQAAHSAEVERLCARLWFTEIGLELGALVQPISVAAVAAPTGSLRAILVPPPPSVVTCPLGLFGLRVGGGRAHRGARSRVGEPHLQRAFTVQQGGGISRISFCCGCCRVHGA